MNNHFILIKMPGYCASGKSISARIAALKLLEAGFWPIFHRTRNKFVMKSGDEIAVYLGGAYNQTRNRMSFNHPISSNLLTSGI